MKKKSNHFQKKLKFASFTQILKQVVQIQFLLLSATFDL